jgi:DNA segregation ATPase FtsK/SpoIIIE, S-DNA-T family
VNRTRRMRRRLHHRDVRGEPLTLLVDDRYPGETLEALVRGIYRYRSELAPLVLGAATGLTAAFLHPRFPGWAPVVALFALIASAALWWVKRLTSGLRRIERAYAAAVTGVAGLWLAAATAMGPGTTPLPTLLVLGTLAAAVPWWWHRRRRARVRVERTLQAWPVISEAVGLHGSRVMSAMVDLWGWHARIGLRRGQTAADVIAKASALESGLGTRPGAVRVEPDPARADHCLIRVLDADPHARAITWPATTSDTEPRTITAPIPLGLFEDAFPVAITLAHRHALVGGVAGAGKSGILNAILASLTGCPDVVLWGVDLKGGMELGPWAPCLDRLATTPAQAAELLADAVAILDARAARLADVGQRLWQPSPAEPALVVVIDEYAELSDDAPAAVGHADSTARRGRAVAVTLLVATQRPTQKAMGSGAVRSQMDVRICLRVRERRDVDLVLGQGMLTAGWHAHTLDAPGKFLLSTPEHTTPRRARAYLLTDTDVTTLTTHHAPTRPALDDASRAAAKSTPAPSADDQQPAIPGPRHSSETLAEPGSTDGEDPETALLCALRQAPPGGASVPDLITATGMRRTWVYHRLHHHITNGRAVQVSRGRWRASHPFEP